MPVVTADVLSSNQTNSNQRSLLRAHRVLQITELVRECLQQRDANCSITPAPPESCTDDSAAALLQVGRVRLGSSLPLKIMPRTPLGRRLSRAWCGS